MPSPFERVTELMNRYPAKIVIRPYERGSYKPAYCIILAATNGSKTVGENKFSPPFWWDTELHIFTDEGGDSMQMLLPLQFLQYVRILFSSVDGRLVIQGIKREDSDDFLRRRHGCGFLGRRNYHYNARVPEPIGISRVMRQPETVIARRNEQGAAIVEHQPLPAEVMHQPETVIAGRNEQGAAIAEHQPLPAEVRRQPETVIAGRNEQGAAIAEHQPLPAEVAHQLEMVTVPRIMWEALTMLQAELVAHQLEMVTVPRIMWDALTMLQAELVAHQLEMVNVPRIMWEALTKLQAKLMQVEGRVVRTDAKIVPVDTDADGEWL